jgi:chromosomal replication initiator protein
MQQQAIEAWEKILPHVKSQVSRATYERWLRNIRPVQITSDTLILGTLSQFAKEWLQRRTKTLIERAAAAAGLDVKVEFVPQQLALQTEAPQEDQAQKPAAEPRQIHTPLNAKYVFDTFVVGQSNRFAQAAAFAVAQKPGQSYNPLFIYGGVGLGKTHLMHAIGHHVRNHFRDLRVTYVSGDTFTYDVVTSIREDRFSDFRHRYRGVDVWLVDDIQFIAARERTEAEFFHAFNALHETNKQIVITSDRPPKQLQVMDERLRSRFEWGLIADIKPPDLETRIAILQAKAQAEGVSAPEDVLRYMASTVQSNIRVLEGALVKVIAASSFLGAPISLALAMDQLKDHCVTDYARPVSVAMVQQAVAEHLHLTPEELVGKRRTKQVAFGRHVAMFLARELARGSFPEIAKKFGGKDHATVMHACRKIRKQMNDEASMRALVGEIAHKLGAVI